MDGHLTRKSGDEKITQIFDRAFATRRSKIYLFFGALIVAMCLSWYFATKYNGGGIDDFLYLLPTAIAFFPIGIVALTASSPSTQLLESLKLVLTFGTWPLYIGIMTIGIRNKNTRISQMLFLTFVLLLMFNVKGCSVNYFFF